MKFGAGGELGRGTLIAMANAASEALGEGSDREKEYCRRDRAPAPHETHCSVGGRREKPGGLSYSYHEEGGSLAGKESSDETSTISRSGCSSAAGAAKAQINMPQPP